MNEAIKRAIEGGYDVDRGYAQENNALARDRFARLDPAFWQALGKALGWGYMEINNGIAGRVLTASQRIDEEEYLYHWIQFIRHLASGKDAESFFKDLLQ